MKNVFKAVLTVLAVIVPILTVAQIVTVRGTIAPEDMGTSLIHEHIMVDWIGADSTASHRWVRNEVVGRAMPFLQELKKYGVTSFIDCTPAYLGRDPYLLKELSELTGIHILTNTGYYGAQNNKFIPKNTQDASPQEMADRWILEFEEGIDDSGIRPGFIKISVDSQDSLSSIHENLARAAAMTHLATGMTIVSHTGTDAPALAQLEVLQEMGVSPSAFVWTHAQNGSMSGYLQAASLGAWISLDNVNARDKGSSKGSGNIPWYVTTLIKLKAEGILDHILISHDAGWYHVGEENGGDFRGYTDLFSELLPLLMENGFTQKDIDLILRENPRRAYEINVRKID